MGSMFRSEEMALCQVFIQPEAAYTSVSAIGEAGIVQFRDLNEDVNAFQRKYVSEVRRGEELGRKLRSIETEVRKDGIHIPEGSDYPNAPNTREIIELEAILERTENEIIELSQNARNLKSNFVELSELKHVLDKTHTFLQEREEDTIGKALVSEDTSAQASRGRLGFVAGVVARERMPAFERMLWRISRGNVFFRRVDLEEPLEDPVTGNQVYKTVFVVFFQGEQLKSRVKKVCAGFHASIYPCPSSYTERQDMVQEVKTRLQDLTTVLNQTAEHRHRVLVSVAKDIHPWKVMVCKMKAIFHTMNCFNVDVTKKCLIGECWVPVKDLDVVRRALADGGKAVGSSIPSFLNVIHTTEEPPTFNRSNKFTYGFQVLIDSYGIASYREVNPALYTIITFPFLFGVMFGDMGHGLILLIFGAWMVIFEKGLMKKKSNNEIWNIFFGGRYIILLMGLFSVYTGFIYNDIFSKSFNIFGSSWRNNYDFNYIHVNDFLQLDPNSTAFTKVPYPIGVDPAWQLADNKIIFLNTYKMKLSIIIGVIHMIFGVTLSVVNNLYYKKAVYIFLEFLPQVLFLIFIFFYLVVLMLLKWILYSADSTDYTTGSTCAPSVLITFINMVMFKETTSPFKECDPYMYPNQHMLQMIFVVIAVLCIPVMLCGKPIYLLCFKKKKPHMAVNHEMDMEMQVNGSARGEHEGKSGEEEEEEEEEEPAGEIIIHQIIHTIEYVLSTISHTASYLRLWALSLAHSQLSDVLWTMVLNKSLTMDSYVGCIAIYIIFAIWAVLTIAILVMMEGLSAFLHTLRLHWVEFMSKFYTGLGYAFQPFSFKTIINEEEHGED